MTEFQPLTAPLIAITAGEPAGIGPDLVIQLAQRKQRSRWLVIADPELLRARAKLLGLAFKPRIFDAHSTTECPTGETWVLPVELAVAAKPAVANPQNAPYVIRTLERAVAGCQSGHFAAMVTGPVNKAIINQGGLHFTGHTEYLAEQTASNSVMMLATESLKVALATTHLPLNKVAPAISEELLHTVIGILHRDLQHRFGIASPRILVCGLNPHAGEDGYLGDEEIHIIKPTLAQLRAQGMRLTGPLPADTLFTPKYLDNADAVLAMYHDQGLPVLKYSGFGEAVNITLGLPIIRASVDHGTAFDLAGSGKADASSLQMALDWAIDMVSSSTSQ